MPLKVIDTRSVIDRTLGNFSLGWRRISAKGKGKTQTLRPELSDSDLDVLRKQMQDCLESRGGEVSARVRAAGLGQVYLDLNDEGRFRFLHLIATEFGVDQSNLKVTLQEFLASADQSAERLEYLRNRLRPPWIKLFTQFNALPSGVKFLIDMRADIIRFSKSRLELEPLNRDLRELLISWFDIGFLELKRITWKEPASLLEKLIEHEAVHEIQSWDDLKNRLDTDRCCYAYFHPRMPEEPLIFVQVALVNGISENIQVLLDDAAPVEDPETADTAIFYSITNTQRGLRGVGLGDFLIKRVVDDLAREFPNLRTFATLSPVSGFRKFVEKLLDTDETRLFNSAERQALDELVNDLSAVCSYEILKARKELVPLLKRLCAHYLINEKRKMGALDSVANFHLTNGAEIEQVNWLGNRSETGLRRSFGLMVNYQYKLSNIEKNHEEYVESGTIKYSSQTKALLKSAKQGVHH